MISQTTICNKNEITNTASKTTIFDKVFYFFSLCPFLFPFPFLKTDIQPYALLFSLLYVLFYFFTTKTFRIHKVILVFAVSLLFTIVISLISENVSIINIIRGLSNYLSLFFITFSTYLITKKNGGIDENFVKLIILLWLVTALIQLFVAKNFLGFIVSGGRTDTSRGVFGLASEPSFFGVQCFYFFFLIKLFKTRTHLYYVIILIMAFLLAQSATGIIFVVLMFGLELLETSFISRKYRYQSIALLIVLIAILVFIGNYLKDSRIFFLLEKAFEQDVTGIAEDESVNTRINTIVQPFTESVKNYFMPFGFEERIGSAFAGILHEIGIFAIGIIVAIPMVLSGYFKSRITKLFSFIFIFALFFFNIQLSNPTLAFVLGIGIYYQDKQFLIREKLIVDEKRD